jgi:two-component system KDP operon response regulator KdpE
MNGHLRILIVDDEQAIRRYLRTVLAAHDYAVQEAETGTGGIEAVALHHPDLVVLDLGLPDIDGIEVIHRLREWTELPIIVLSVRGQERDKVMALDAGADDYLTKPFGTAELLARVRANLRRVTQPCDRPVFQIDDLVIDLAHRRVSLQGQEIQLTPTEYDLLRELVQNAGKVMTHRQLLQAVWGPAYAGATHLLRVNISNLRQKVEPDASRPHYIITEPGVGYRLRGE